MTLGAGAVPVLEVDGRRRVVPATMVAPGMTVLVAAGERIGVDGTVLDGASALDTSLITGETFSSVSDLKRILVTGHRADFYRTLTAKMLTYATGRGPEYYDVETIDQIVKRLDDNDGRFSALLLGVVESAPFQKMRTQATMTVAN